jgi:hypothetical protein
MVIGRDLEDLHTGTSGWAPLENSRYRLAHQTIPIDLETSRAPRFRNFNNGLSRPRLYVKYELRLRPQPRATLTHSVAYLI